MSPLSYVLDGRKCIGFVLLRAARASKAFCGIESEPAGSRRVLCSRPVRSLFDF
jgi:hypothetical protein